MRSSAAPVDDVARPPTSTITEASLLHGYSRVTERPRIVVLEQRDCCCGAAVTADPKAPAAGVAEHNGSLEHETWAITHGWRDG